MTGGHREREREREREKEPEREVLGWRCRKYHSEDGQEIYVLEYEEKKSYSMI